MVRFVRIHAEGDAAPAGLAEIAAAGPLDLLQLDYARPRLASAAGPAPPELPERALSFLDVVHSLCKTLFLEPNFRVVTSAGWSDSYAGVEQIGQALAAGGSPDVPLSAVRGSNLLGILDFLAADGLPLNNIETGAPWKSLREPVLAADLQLGAGPIVTALQEGARVIVAGCYDGAAPLIAAAMHAFHWNWKQANSLAAAASAARAAIWPHRHTCDALALTGALPATHLHPRVELDAKGHFTVDVAHACDRDDAEQLIAWLRAGRPRGPSHLHADVAFDAAAASVSQPGPSQFRVAGCTGATTDDHWRLEVLYQVGFVSEAMIEFSAGAGATMRSQVAEAFRSHFVGAEDERSLVTVQELAGADGGAASASWLHLACRTKVRRQCVEFAEHVGRLARSNPQVLRLPAGRPQVLAECGLWPARVPRNAIDIAIDTRPAREWA